VAPQLSPRTWGWTWTPSQAGHPAAVVPTHVGVDPPRRSPRSPRSGCPHARGGGPRGTPAALPALPLSPRTWGWTVRAQPAHRFGVVVPTHVGVDPAVAFSTCSSRCCPHARGGGPFPRGWAPGERRLSPRTWGWTSSLRRPRLRRRVVPTHVGVDPVSSPSRASRRSCPHARGGGPGDIAVSISLGSLSPRTWGWTRHTDVSICHVLVVPTHVGVDRRWRSGWSRCPCCPHARGGGPRAREKMQLVVTLSPRTWGWTHPSTLMPAPYTVVPTHVGVDR